MTADRGPASRVWLRNLGLLVLAWEIAGRLDMTPGAVKVAAHRLRKRYREILREEIGDTVSSPEEIEEEIRHLFRSLAAP